MRSSEIGDLVCPIARAVGTVGDPWTLMIVRELFLGSRKFDELQAQLRASPAVITQRLKDLLDEDIVSKRLYQESPARYEYHLTRKGLDLWPLMMAFKHWGDRWGGWKGKKPAELHHLDCGGSTGMKLICECCGEEVTPHNVELHQHAQMRNQRAAFLEVQRQQSAAKVEQRGVARRLAAQERLSGA